MVRLHLPQLLGSLVEQGDSVVAQEFFGPVLRLFPGWDGAYQQLLPLGGQPKGLHPGVIIGYDFQPTLAAHPFDVPAERGRVQLEDVADHGRASQSDFGRHNEDIQLTDLQPQVAQGVVIQVCYDTVQQAQAHRNTLAGNRVN